MFVLQFQGHKIMEKTTEQIKSTEEETLATFQEEIPSQYFSHLDKVEYDRYSATAEAFYRNLFKFPKEMFAGKELIDFGAGTGENTVYLANWGAKCTLVEMNYMSQDISKEVFKKYCTNPHKPNFVLSSIFDYQPNDGKQYDIVHSRGVLSHTAAKEKAFQHIASFLKPEGYLIFGDPNKSGGFQNMLQRYAVYKFAKSPDEMVDVCETLFKDDIDRSEKTVKRTRRAIIFDRWVIQSQDDPSVSEVASWCNQAGLKMYSSYPYSTPSLSGDSFLHLNTCDPFSFTNLFALPELTWMMQTEEDNSVMARYDDLLANSNEKLQDLAALMANFNKHTTLDKNNFKDIATDLENEVMSVDFILPLKEKLKIFLGEAIAFIEAVDTCDFNEVTNAIKQSSILFTGAVGVRHVDFIAYKEK
jgi:2-polyprenyl-3-methyl-5-hydroxy-6-metoxy-1,4-benzoquinol methylase